MIIKINNASIIFNVIMILFFLLSSAGHREKRGFSLLCCRIFRSPAAVEEISLPPEHNPVYEDIDDKVILSQTEAKMPMAKNVAYGQVKAAVPTSRNVTYEVV